MSITKYFTQRNNKVISDEPTPACSPLHSESSESITAIPATQATPLQRQVTQDKDNKDNSLLSQSQTLPLGLADMEEREEQEKENKVPGAPKKPERLSQEMELTLLLTLMRLFWPEPQLTSTMTTMHLQTIHKLCKAKQKVMMRKRLLWQLLLQRSGVQATTTVLVAAGLSSSVHSATATPKDLPQGTTLLIKEWLPRTAKKKETGEEFKMFDLVDINGGLWYGVPIFTFWRDQVDKGVIWSQT